MYFIKGINFHRGTLLPRLWKIVFIRERFFTSISLVFLQFHAWMKRFYLKQPFLDSYRSRVKSFKALPEFISINVINFQFFNFTQTATSGMTLSLSSIVTVSVSHRDSSFENVFNGHIFSTLPITESTFYGNLNKYKFARDISIK